MPRYFVVFIKLRGPCSGDPFLSTFLTQELHSRNSRKVFETLKGENKIFQIIYSESFI